MTDAGCGEWARLDALCHAGVSLFHRDRAVSAALDETVLRERLSRAGVGGRRVLRARSAGGAP